MPFKKTDEGFEYGEEGDHVMDNRSSSNPFLQPRTIRDTQGRPLKWCRHICDYIVDIDKWIEEKESNDTSIRE